MTLVRSLPAARSFIVRTARVVLLAAALAIAGSSLSLHPAAGPPSADAAPCVRFVASRFDATGNDNYMPYLNGEWVRIKNVCSASRSLGGWRIHDYGTKHTYWFGSTVRIGAGAAITLRSGLGTNTTTTRYWKRSYGAVWNNSAPERAYLKNPYGTLQHSWSEY